MAGFLCPYCGMVIALDEKTKQSRYPSFDSTNGITSWGPNKVVVYGDSTIKLEFFKCPNCEEYTIKATGCGGSVLDVNVPIRPLSNARKYPKYIPEAIRADYEEACAILHLSPKASATLARRCLQGMIRDYWDIKRNTLNKEILELKDRIQPDLWRAIDSLRLLGNIGAHMESDVNLIIDIDEGEAEKLIKLIELLMKEWYINREERNLLFEDIFHTNENKQAQRKGEE